MSTKHTPGPWGFSRWQGRPDHITAANAPGIAQMGIWQGVVEEAEQMANAQLIAAAPELREEAHMALAAMRMELGESAAPEFGPRALYDAATAVIAKAEGKS